MKDVYNDLLEKAIFKQKENEELNNYLISSIHGGVSVCQRINEKLKTLSFTVGVPALLGYTEEEYKNCIKDDTFSVVYIEDRRKIFNIIDNIDEENAVKNTSVRCYCKDGSLTWLNLSAKNIGQKDGLPIWYIISMSMSDESKLYYDIVHGSTNGVYVVEQESYRILYANNAMEKILADVGIYDYLGEKCYCALKGRDKPCDKCLALLYENPGETNEMYIDFLQKYYSIVSHEINWRGILSYVIYLSDISEQKKANMEITQLYNNIPGAVFCCKFDADWTVVSANDGLFEFLGYTREEFKAMGNKMSAVVHHEDLPNILPAISAQLESGGVSVEHEQRLICKDGKIKWILIRGQLLESDKDSELLYCVFVDISEQKKAQLELNKTQKKLTAAIDHAGLAYWEYDIKNNKVYLSSMSTAEYSINNAIENCPESICKAGTIHPDSIGLYESLVQDVKDGKPTASGDIKTIDIKGNLIWKRVRFTTLFDEYNRPFWAIATAENINEYKELENRFSTVLEQNHIESWIYDIPRHTIIQNHNTEEIYGIHSKEVSNVPESLIEMNLCHPNDCEHLRCFYKRIENGETQISDVFRIWDVRVQSYVWKRTIYTILPNRNGKPIYALASSVDVTDQVEAKRKYEDAIKYRYSTLSENAILAGHCNITHNVILEVEDKTGLDLKNRFGMVREDFFHGMASFIPNAEQQQMFCKTFLNENIKNSFELGITQHTYDCTINLGKDMGIRWISTHIDTALQPETNELIGFLTIVDVSANKMQKQVLDSVIQFDYDYVAHLNLHWDTMVFYSNKNQGTELKDYEYGVSYSYTNAIEYTAEKYISNDDKMLYLEKMSIVNVYRKLQENDSYEFTYHILTSDNGLRTKRARFAMYDRIAGIAIFSRADVTDMLAQQEKQKIALSESLAIAQQANNAKSKFLSSMSHDIRTPMNAIIGMCNLAIDDESDSRQIHESLQVIKQSSSLLLSIINDILDMNRIESGKMVLISESFLISEQMNIAVDRVKAIASKKHQNIDLSMDIIHDCCCGDIVRIHRVIDNIIFNALKFTSDGGRIGYHLSESALENKNIGLYRFEISDNGIGISPEQQKYIFEPFYRVQNSMTSQIEGTGLGLSIAKSIVDYMGGTISVHSTIGIGTTFVIELPLRFAQEVAEVEDDKKMPVSSFDLSDVHVLLCEDHPVNQLVARKILEKEGATVTVADNGQAGYELFLQSTPGTFDVILMDIQMPVMNGYEAAHAIRECSHARAKTIPIIAMTANAFAEDVQKSIESGMNSHLAKPIEPKQLYDVLERFIR